MPFYRWATFQDLVSLQERMNRILEDAIRRGNFSTDEREPGQWSPPCDVFETPDAFHLNLEIPGVSRQDIDLQVVGEQLVVRGTRRTPENADREAFVRMERTYGPFRREFRIPKDLDGEATSADLECGVLVIRIPRSGSATRAVLVQGGASGESR